MTQPQGEVFDIGYQRYQGPREGRWRSRMAMFENGVRTVLGLGRGGRAKILPALLFIASILPALIIVLIVSTTSELASPAGPAEYYDVISQILLIFAAIIAPELLIPDRRERVLHLYLVRPITFTDYLVSRVAAFLAVVLALVFSGQIILQIGMLLAVDDPVKYFREHWLDIPRFLASGALIALFITLIPMAVAAFMARRAFATATVIGIWFVCATIFGATSAQECNITRDPIGRPMGRECHYLVGDERAKWLPLIDVGSVPLHMNTLIFGKDRAQSGNGAVKQMAPVSPLVPIGWYTVLVAGPGLLLWWRYRRIRI